VTTTELRSAGSSRAITIAWLILSAITLISWWLAPGHSGGLATASVPITVLAVLLGFLKCRMIIRSFMEVRHAPSWLRHSTDLWLVVLWASVLVIYLW
jgi:hypothetical protein